MCFPHRAIFARYLAFSGSDAMPPAEKLLPSHLSTMQRCSLELADPEVFKILHMRDSIDFFVTQCAFERSDLSADSFLAFLLANYTSHFCDVDDVVCC